MRQFKSGATRSDIEGKLSYMRALSPAVLRRYVQYLAKHRKQTDGQMRSFDNWKKGIDPDTYLDGLLRHTVDAWLTYRGYKPSDETYDLQDLLCAIIFNASGWLFELLVAEGESRENPMAPIEPEKPRTCEECAKIGECEYGQAHSKDVAGCSVYTPKVPA